MDFFRKKNNQQHRATEVKMDKSIFQIFQHFILQVEVQSSEVRSVLVLTYSDGQPLLILLVPTKPYSLGMQHGKLEAPLLVLEMGEFPP